MLRRLQVRRSDVQSAWSGIRPLAVDPRAKDTASALRDHIVLVGDDGLLTVTGAGLARHKLSESVSADTYDTGNHEPVTGKDRILVDRAKSPLISALFPANQTSLRFA
jgi:glycerol-3-phosphate dehydrogenase